MIRIERTNKIDSNGSIQMNGKLLKVVVITKEKLSHVRVKLSSASGEVIVDDNLDHDKLRTVFYPRCVVSLDQYSSNLDYYYLAESIKVELEGLGNDFIDDIIFYLE